MQKAGPDTPRCEYFIPSKKRRCKFQVKPGQRYCGNHLFVALQKGEKRVPCPVDPRHTVLESELKAHIRRCPKAHELLEQQAQPYYEKDTNAGSDDEDSSDLDVCGDGVDPHKQGHILSTRDIPHDPAVFSQGLSAERHARAKAMGPDRFMEIVQKVEDAFARLHPREGLPTRVTLPEYCQQYMAPSPNRPYWPKHALQQASMIGNMESAGLLPLLPECVLVEYGAGKGYLSDMIAECCGAARVVLMDCRGCFKLKADRSLRKCIGPTNLQRLTCPIQDFRVSQVPGLHSGRAPWVAAGKHLCGAASDFMLRSCKQAEVDAVREIPVADKSAQLQGHWGKDRRGRRRHRHKNDTDCVVSNGDADGNCVMQNGDHDEDTGDGNESAPSSDDDVTEPAANGGRKCSGTGAHDANNDDADEPTAGSPVNRTDADDANDEDSDDPGSAVIRTGAKIASGIHGGGGNGGAESWGSDDAEPQPPQDNPDNLTNAAETTVIASEGPAIQAGSGHASGTSGTHDSGTSGARASDTSGAHGSGTSGAHDSGTLGAHDSSTGPGDPLPSTSPRGPPARVSHSPGGGSAPVRRSSSGDPLRTFPLADIPTTSSVSAIPPPPFFSDDVRPWTPKTPSFIPQPPPLVIPPRSASLNRGQPSPSSGQTAANAGQTAAAGGSSRIVFTPRTPSLIPRPVFNPNTPTTTPRVSSITPRTPSLIPRAPSFNPTPRTSFTTPRSASTSPRSHASSARTPQSHSLLQTARSSQSDSSLAEEDNSFGVDHSAGPSGSTRPVAADGAEEDNSFGVGHPAGPSGSSRPISADAAEEDVGPRSFLPGTPRLQDTVSHPTPPASPTAQPNPNSQRPDVSPVASPPGTPKQEVEPSADALDLTDADGPDSDVVERTGITEVIEHSASDDSSAQEGQAVVSSDACDENTVAGGTSPIMDTAQEGQHVVADDLSESPADGLSPSPAEGGSGGETQAGVQSHPVNVTPHKDPSQPPSDTTGVVEASTTADGTEQTQGSGTLGTDVNESSADGEADRHGALGGAVNGCSTDGEVDGHHSGEIIQSGEVAAGKLLDVEAVKDQKSNAVQDETVQDLNETVGPCGLQAVVLAPCCHHRCTWRAYVGKQVMKELGIGKEEFEIISWMTGWALCGHDSPPGAGELDDEEEEEDVEENDGSLPGAGQVDKQGKEEDVTDLDDAGMGQDKEQLLQQDAAAVVGEPIQEEDGDEEGALDPDMDAALSEWVQENKTTTTTPLTEPQNKAPLTEPQNTEGEAQVDMGGSALTTKNSNRVTNNNSNTHHNKDNSHSNHRDSNNGSDTGNNNSDTTDEQSAQPEAVVDAGDDGGVPAGRNGGAAVSKHGTSGAVDSDGDRGEHGEEGGDFDPAYLMSRSERMALGLKCKLLIDLGRKVWMEERGWDTDMAVYIQPEVSGENKLFVARCKGMK